MFWTVEAVCLIPEPCVLVCCVTVYVRAPHRPHGATSVDFQFPVRPDLSAQLRSASDCHRSGAAGPEYKSDLVESNYDDNQETQQIAKSELFMWFHPAVQQKKET